MPEASSGATCVYARERGVEARHMCGGVKYWAGMREMTGWASTSKAGYCAIGKEADGSVGEQVRVLSSEELGTCMRKGI